MQIRRFKNGDEIPLYKVFFSSVHVIAARDYTIEQIKAWAPVNADLDVWSILMKNLNPFVVELNDEIVGYADIQPSGYMDHFYVSGAYPRQKIGSHLMNRILEEAHLMGVCELTSNVSKTAEPFFKLHGFHVEERRFPVRHGIMLQNALMRKKMK